MIDQLIKKIKETGNPTVVGLDPTLVMIPNYLKKEMFEKYDHPLHKEYVSMGQKAGHGGMDWLVCRAFIESVKNGTNTPIDAYDTATWMAIAPLSEASIAKGGAPVEFPDFTKGKWLNRESVVKCKYCLEEVCVDENTTIY